MITKQQILLRLIEEKEKLLISPVMRPYFLNAEISKKIPAFLGRFLRQLGLMARGVTKTAQSLNQFNQGLKPLMLAAPWLLALGSFVDFLYIPLLYLCAYLAGIRLPFSLNKAAKVIYNSAMVGLSVACILFPPLAPILACAFSSVVLIFSVWTLCKSLYRRRVLTELKPILERKLREAETAFNNECDLVKNAEKFNQLSEFEKGNLAKSINEKFEVLQKLRLEHSQVIRSLDRKNTRVIKEKASVAIISSLILIGVVLSFVFPPVGFGILAVSAGAGVTFGLVKLSQFFLKRDKSSAGTKPAKGTSEKTGEGETYPMGCENTRVKFPELRDNHHLRDYTGSTPACPTDNSYKRPDSPNITFHP